MIPVEKIEKLEALGRRLVDVALEEADPEKWPGTATKQDRGDRVWMKKNVAATLMLIDQIQRLVRSQPFEAPPPSAGDDELSEEDRLIMEAEKRAGAMLDRQGIETPH